MTWSDLKNTFTILFKLIVKPDKAWSEIRQNNISAACFRNLHIPVCVSFGIVLQVLVSGYSGWQDCIGQWILNFLALYSGLYVAAILIQFLSKRFLKENFGFQKCLEFCSFASGYLFIATIVGIVSNSLLATIILSLYLFQIVYDGIKHFLPNYSDKFGLLSLVTGSILILSPLITKGIILLLMPNIA